LRYSQIIIYFCVTKFKGIKKTGKILDFSIDGIILFIILLFMLLQTSMMKIAVSNFVVSELSDKLHTKVTVGKIEYRLFDDLVIHDLYVEDQHKDTLLFVSRADAHFKFWKFFQGKVIFTSVELDQLFGNLIIDKTGNSNLDFIINAFKKPATKDTTQVEYRINRFKLKNCRFNYSNYKELKNLPPNVFNGNKLRIKNINANISLNIIKKDSITLKVSSLSAEEHSGLTLTNFNTQIAASAKELKIPFVEIQMPNSKIRLDDIQLKYKSMADLQNFNRNVKWNAPISSSTIAFSDLRAFVPAFKNIKGVATIKGLITGRVSSLRFQKMEVKYGNSMFLNADLDVNGLPDLREVFIYGKINELHCDRGDIQDFLSQLNRKPFLLPNEVAQLGLIRYKGNITGFLNNLVIYGNLTTNVGSVSSDILLKIQNNLKDFEYNGTIKSESILLGKLLSNKQFGNVSFNLNTKGTKKENTKFQGTIQAKIPEFQYNNYTYRDIQLNGKYDGKGYDGAVNLQDQNINARFAGKIDLTQKLPVYDFGLKVNNINPNALKLTDKYPGATLSFNGQTNMVGNSLDNINGFIRFDSIEFKNQNKTLNVDKIQFVSRIDKDLTQFSISSDYVNGAFSGNFKYSTIGQTIDKIVQKYLPSLATSAKPTTQKTQNHIDIDLQIANTSEVSNVLDLSYTLDGVSTIKGVIDEKSNKIDVSANFPMMKSSKQQIENISLHFENLGKELQFTSRAQLQEKDGLMNVFLKAAAVKDSLITQLGWQNAQSITNAGEIKSITRFKKDHDKSSAELSILPTQVIILDSIWNIHPCKIDFKSDSTIQVHNFVFEKNNQFIHINGIASKNQNDGLSLDMNKLDLDFIMILLRLKGFSISGLVTGKATLLSVLQQPIFEANLGVQDLKLNHKWVGNGKVSSNWDKENSLLLAHGAFVNEKNDTVVIANGLFNPKADTISVLYDARNFSIEFLSQYFESVVQNVKGLATGKIRMFGPLKRGMCFEGNAFVDKGQATMKMLKTTYFLNDSVHMTQNSIQLKNIKVYDQERNPASLNATLTHNGFFQHMKFNADIAGKNILALNTQAEDNDYFFGKAYANGKVHIYGDEKVANIDVIATSQPQTKCFIQMGGASKVLDNSFIHFVNKKSNDTRKDNISPTRKVASTDMNVKVNLQIDITPDAEMELIVDPKGGDMIRGNGNGNLRVAFDTFSDIKLYGTYTINSGYYLFTLQNLIRKEFKIDQGSTLSWTGNPYQAKGDIRALYSLTASLKDLDETLASTTTRTSVPVNCVLKLSDNIMKPTVNFDINLPQSDEGVKQRVRNIINTDEMMNRQILYLLVFNKFYTPDYMRAAASTNVGSSEAISFATSTLSAQLNNWVSQMSKSNNFSFGIDWQRTDQTYSDVFQAQILYQPNNRLIINGNLGYRNDNLINNTNRFIGDIDIQYLLTESGKLRFKAYNHTIDRYQLSKATQTQGVGFIYKEDFNSMSELFNYYWRFIVGTKKTKTDEKKTPSQK
jgi:Family of unknown function (DUF490).